MSDAYREDLAHVHDDSFGFIATGAAKTLVTRLIEQELRSGLVVELAVGSGISSEILVASGFDVLGYDISPEMIELARGRAGAARFEVCSLYDAEIPSCVAVTGIGEAFNYRFDERAGLEAVKQVFARAFAALVPGGVLMFDVAQPGRALPRLEHHFWEGRGWHVTSETIEDPERRLLHRKITTTRDTPDGERVTVENHELALYDHEELYEALREAGFVAHTLATYAEDFRFGEGHGAFAAYKPRR